MEWFNLLIFILLLSLIALCQFDKIVISLLKDILPGIMHCYTMHCLLITALYFITKHLLMLPLTIVTKTINLAISSAYIKKHKYPAWPSGKLKFYTEKIFL
jgi:hypothetical protein